MADIQHSSYRKFAPLWCKVRDVVAGEEMVKERRTQYLPMLTSQAEAGDRFAAESYASYLARASLYGAAGRTRLGLVGAILRKDPTIDGVPDEFMDDLEDAAGREYEPLKSIVMQTLSDLVSVGRCALLVDKEPDPEALPYILKIDAENVVYWVKRASKEGREVPTLIVLRQNYEVPKMGDVVGNQSEYKMEWRMLRLGRMPDYVEGVEGAEGFAGASSDEDIYWQEVWRESQAKKVSGTGFDLSLVKVIVPTKDGGRFWNEIPCDIVNAVGGITLEVEDPPMLALANVVLAHYRGSADLEWGRHLCAIPQPWASGFQIDEGERLITGCGYAWVTSATGANVQYLEFTGAGLGHLAEGLKEKEKQMAVLGARMLEEQPSGVEAMGTVRLRQSGDRSVLATIAHSCSVAITRAMQRVLAWRSPAFDSPEAAADVVLTLATDFDAAPIDPAELAALTASLQAGTISWETFVHNLRRGEVLPPGVTDDEERDRIQFGAPGRARKDELTQLQLDVQSGRISNATYLDQIQKLGMLPGVDIEAELAAIKEESDQAAVRQMEAFMAQSSPGGRPNGPVDVGPSEPETEDSDSSDSSEGEETDDDITVNEITLGIERLARIKDVKLVQVMRDQLAAKLGVASQGKLVLPKNPTP